VTLDGQTVTVLYSLSEPADPAVLLDGNPGTLLRGFEANPWIVEFQFPEPRRIGSIELTVGSMPEFIVTVTQAAAAGGPPVIDGHTFTVSAPDPTVAFELSPEAQPVASLRLEIEFPAAGDTAMIHVREIAFR
jgi:hypothetical protein